MFVVGIRRLEEEEDCFFTGFNYLIVRTNLMPKSSHLMIFCRQMTDGQTDYLTPAHAFHEVNMYSNLMCRNVENIVQVTAMAT